MPAPTPTLLTDTIRGNVEVELYLRFNASVTMVGTYLVPDFNAAQFSVSGQNASVELYEQLVARSAKTSASATLGFTGYAALDNVIMTAAVNAALAIGNAARGTFILVFPDRSAVSGNIISQNWTPNLDRSAVNSNAFTYTVDGTPTFTVDVDSV